MGINTALRRYLGATYGGPSLSYEDGEYVLYTWTDAPVNIEIIARSPSLHGLLLELERKKR